MNQDPKTLLAKYQPKQVKEVKLDQQLCMVRYSPCAKVLAAGSFENVVRRWDAATEQMAELPPLKGHGGWVQCVAFGNDSKQLFSADTWGQVCCWPYAEKDAKPLWTVKQAHDGWVRVLAVSPDGRSLATAGADKKVRLWSATDGKKLQEWDAVEDIFSLAFHPDGKSLVSGDLKGIVKQWDLATSKSTRQFDAKILYFFERLQDVGGVRKLAFDKAGATLACAGGQPKSGGFVQASPVILLFDWQSGKLTHTLKLGGENDGYVYDLHFHPDGFIMAVTSGQPGVGKLFFHQPGDVQPFFTGSMANCHSLAMHPNGSRFIVSSTNANSSGNGRNLGPNKEYPGNSSPLFIWEMPKG